MLSFFGMMIGSGGFFRFLLIRHDRKKEAEELKEKEEARLEALRIEQREQETANLIKNLVDMSCATTQDRIVWQIEQHKKHNQITLQDKVIIEEMYTPYRNLGKNHLAKEAMLMLDSIPTVEEYTYNEKEK